MRTTTAPVAMSFLAALTLAAQTPDRGTVDGWPAYGHDPGGMRYSPLTQISRQNVSRLKMAWTYHTGDVSDGRDGQRDAQKEGRKAGQSAQERDGGAQRRGPRIKRGDADGAADFPRRGPRQHQLLKVLGR